jgi:hypothetical protein
MLAAVVHQGNRFHGKFYSVEKELIRFACIRGKPGDGDVINSLPVAVMDFIGRPAFRKKKLDDL